MERLGYAFSDTTLLHSALVHRSYAAERSEQGDNERLEFLGDAVLQLVVTDYLYLNFPTLPEGKMAKVRAACVNKEELAEIARAIELDQHVLLGRGESASGGRTKDSILADAMEAVIAAVYLDRGIEAAREVVLRHWEALILSRAEDPGHRDYKTRLQEALAMRSLKPRYQVTEEGPDHAKVFSATLEIDGTVAGSGVGKSKKEAEQAAAQVALAQFRA